MGLRGREKLMKRYYSETKDARKAYQKNYRKLNPIAYKNVELKRDYGITIDDYDNMVKKQQNRCAICNSHQSELKQTLHVDHCHSTGKVRGLLCKKCNSAIGLFEDSQDRLKRAIEYIGGINGS